jgi:transcriptional adapter 2-alpha
MEIGLCSTLRLLPAHYLVIRDTIVRESIRLGYLSAVDANALLNIDIRKTGRLYDFFVSAGWVTAPKDNSGSSSSSSRKEK